jgi:hypothetical protein
VRLRLLWAAPAYGLAVDLHLRDWAAAALAFAAVLILVAGDWWNRRGRKAARELGAKSRARVEALADALRDAGSPVPEGAR